MPRFLSNIRDLLFEIRLGRARFRLRGCSMNQFRRLGLVQRSGLEIKLGLRSSER